MTSSVRVNFGRSSAAKAWDTKIAARKSAARRRGAVRIGERLCRFRREAHDDIEARGELVNARAFHGRKGNRDGLALFLVLDALVNTVTVVARMAFDVALGDEFLAAFHLDR